MADSKYKKGLNRQAYECFQKMAAFNEKKRYCDDTSGKIFSQNTYKTYIKHTKYFIRFVKKEHPECTSLKKAEKYVPEFLQNRVDQGLSAWTIHTEEAALNKLYQIKADDPKRFVAPKRERVNIVRSRGEVPTDRHFSEKNNAELIHFCKNTGLRRAELIALKGSDLVDRRKLQAIKIAVGEAEYNPAAEALEAFDNKYFVHVRSGKGGKERFVPILKDDKAVVDRMHATAPHEKVWLFVHSHADIHSYRSDYATAIYKQYARPIDSIPYDRYSPGLNANYQSQVYHCRGDEAGKKMDKNAMYKASKALGHNRLEIIAKNYLRGI